ncbi:hypothetical protein EB73_08475 [Mycobacterium sp. SWH-M3]|nr:hypothetical protein EB73_08475 [Mycobacterium sp. SWH-M3]
MTQPIDYSRPVELTCALNADKTVTRLIPVLLVQAFAIWLLVALALGLMFPHVAAVSLVGGIIVAAAVCVPRYFRKRDELRRTYGQLQRLILHPGGLRKSDDSVVIDMPWAQITRFEYRNSALPPMRNPTLAGNAMRPAASAALRHAHTVMGWGIVGYGLVTPLPGASARKLKFLDELGRSNLLNGQPHQSPDCLIFPAEFEPNWPSGVVGAWLRHYRPDLVLPALER